MQRRAVETIDIHFHAVPSLFVSILRKGEFAEAVEIQNADGVDRLIFHAPPGVAIEPSTTLRPRAYDEALLLAALDHRKLDAAAVSAPPELFMYWAAPETGERLSRAMNDGYAQMMRQHPRRFLPLATLPLQDAERAARELERAVTQLGLRGASICTHVNGKDLDHPDIAPVFAMAEKLDVPIFLHPQNAGDISRIKDYHLWNLAGFPMETAIAASRLILSGTFERYPGLKIVLAHGGGFFPYQIGRLDHGFEVRKEINGHLPKPPSAYLKNIYCDSLTHSDKSQHFLIDRIGFDHVVLGTDHPFDMQTERPVDEIAALQLPVEQQKAILGGTLKKLLKVK